MKTTSRAVKVILPIAVLGALGIAAAAMVNPRQGYAPKQPIFFQHKRMAGPGNWVKDAAGKEVNLGGFDIPCRYCHTMPYEGRHSTLPSTDICMNCHTVVGQDKEWVLVLKGYADRGEPIPWVKVHDLPDFAYFDHSAHLNAKNDKALPKLDCPVCHVDIATADTVAVKTRFNMGWCLECHRKPDMAAPTTCVACHR
jgi:hypothetical protein